MQAFLRLSILFFVALLSIPTVHAQGQDQRQVQRQRQTRMQRRAQAHVLRLDLAENAGAVITTPVRANQEYKVEIFNAIPDEHRYLYTVSISIDVEPIDELAWQGVKSRADIATLDMNDEGCRQDSIRRREHTTLFNRIYESGSEEDVRTRILALADKEAEFQDPDCIPDNDVDQAVRDTRTGETERSYVLRQGERLTVVVRRTAVLGGTPREWTAVFTTGPRGRWVASYGPAVIAQAFWNETTYFADTRTADDGTTTFVLTPEVDRTVLTPVGSVFFTWLPAGSAGRDRTCTWSGFLGLDLQTNLTFGFGPALSYNENIMVHAGLALHSVETLLERYDPDTAGTIELTSPLTFDQLHDPRYRVNPYFAVTFRFGANPFGGGRDPNEDTRTTD